MRQSFLTNDQLLFLQTEKQSLNEILASLKAFNLSDESLHNLRKAIDQLDELFLIVAVGEFNAGKSALINAMLDILDGHVLMGVSRLIQASTLIICIALGLATTMLLMGVDSL